MFQLERDLILFLLAFKAVSALNGPLKVANNPKRNSLSSSDSTFYSPYQRKLPLLAKITPIDQSDSQVGGTFTSYIYLDSIAPNSYPFYSVLCQKNFTKENNFEVLNQKINDMTFKLNKILNLLNYDIKGENKFSERISSFKNKTRTKAILKDDADGFLEEALKNEIIGNSVQKNIFQCEGVYCPENSESCKITQHAIEPSYEKVLKTVFCLGTDNKILLKAENEVMNPSKSSLNTSKTVVRNQIQQNIDEKFQNEMENFKTSMLQTFG